MKQVFIHGIIPNGGQEAQIDVINLRESVWNDSKYFYQNKIVNLRNQINLVKFLEIIYIYIFFLSTINLNIYGV